MRFVFQSDNGEKVLVSTNLYSDIRYGDKIKIDGKLENQELLQKVIRVESLTTARIYPRTIFTTR